MACHGQLEYCNELYLHRIFYQFFTNTKCLILWGRYWRNTMYEIHLDVYCQFMYVYFTRFSSIGFYRKCFLHVFLTLRLTPHEVELMLMSYYTTGRLSMWPEWNLWNRGLWRISPIKSAMNEVCTVLCYLYRLSNLFPHCLDSVWGLYTSTSWSLCCISVLQLTKNKCKNTFRIKYVWYNCGLFKKLP